MQESWDFTQKIIRICEKQIEIRQEKFQKRDVKLMNSPEKSQLWVISWKQFRNVPKKIQCFWEKIWQTNFTDSNVAGGKFLWSNAAIIGEPARRTTPKPADVWLVTHLTLVRIQISAPVGDLWSWFSVTKLYSWRWFAPVHTLKSDLITQCWMREAAQFQPKQFRVWVQEVKPKAASQTRCKFTNQDWRQNLISVLQREAQAVPLILLLQSRIKNFSALW